MKKLTQPHTKIRPRGNKRPKDNILRIKSDIFSLSDNHTDLEIMDLLGINNQTYYRLKGELYQEAKEIWSQTYKESEVYRAIHTMNSINLALRTHKEIILDKTQSAKDRMEACEKLVDTEMNFLKLVSELNDNNITTSVSTIENHDHEITEAEWRANGQRVLAEGNKE